MTPGEIDLGIIVRRFNLDTDAADFSALSADENARASRFRFARDARRWAACRALLRWSLGAALGQAPETLSFVLGPHGKPGLPGCPLRFSLSHSGNIALLALAWDREVGVDIERRRDDFTPEDLAPSALSAAEQTWLSQAPPAERHAAFLSLWTAKEAYVKVGGLGLSFPLTRLTLLPQSGSDALTVRDLTIGAGSAGIGVRRLEAGPEHFAALAVSGPN